MKLLMEICRLCLMKQKLDESQIESVERILEWYKELSHLKVRTLGDLLILDSMPDGKRYSHTRFRCLSKNIFCLECQREINGK